MQRSWLRSFAHDHRAMLYWVAGVAIATIGVTLALSSAIPDAMFALLAVPLLLLAGLAAALAEIVHAFRHRHGDSRAVGLAIAGTMGLGISGLPLVAGLAFATIWIADYATLLRCFPTFERVVAEVRRGTIAPTGAWQERDGIAFMIDASPSRRVVFRLSRAGYGRNGIVHDPAGEVMASDPVDPTMRDQRHHIGVATVRRCRATLITAYYRCDLWGFDED